MPFCFRVFPEILTPSEKLGQNKLSGSLNQTKIKYHIKDNTIYSLSQYFISIYGVPFIKPLQFFHEITKKLRQGAYDKISSLPAILHKSQILSISNSSESPQA